MSKKGGSDYKILSAKTVKVTAPVLAIAGWLATMVPTMAINASYSNNDFRACAGQLSYVNINADAASQACAGALRPRELSSCVVSISRQTKINAVDALNTCRQVRRPEELASCVVGISRIPTQEQPNLNIVNYCGRSLLPIRFGQCVVGLRSELKLALDRALDTCISGSDTISTSTSVVIPQTPSATESLPNVERVPATR
ncbi:hypothetical protein NIES22_07570 [Calothrix brevissima NIES-22]|nr:hypothetical protein NIES22_07570 [Calothrix brevissima NIES-22]